MAESEQKGCGTVLAILAGVCGFAILVGNMAGLDRNAREPEQILVGLDGSVTQVERYLKETLNDPDSYQSIAWSPLKEDQKTGISSVCHRYRARNVFGGMVIKTQCFSLLQDGKIIAVSEPE